MTSFFEWLDTQFLGWVLSNRTHELDILMPILREKLTWIPLYGIMAYALYKRFSWSIWKPLIAIALLITATDGLSSKVLKPYIQRQRPCHQQAGTYTTDTPLPPPIIACGSGYSMPSAHATNHFGIALLVGLWLCPVYGRWVLGGLLLWATSVAAAQVYCGVHYPTDVLAGAALGSALAGAVWRMGARVASFI